MRDFRPGSDLRDTARGMSRKNVEIVRGIYAEWEKGDFSSAEWADADIEYTPPSETRETRGLDAMARRWRDWLGAWKDFAALPEEFIDAGDRVLVLTRFRGRGRGSGTPITDFPGAALFTLRDGRVVRLILYNDVREALEAAGLQE